MPATLAQLRARARVLADMTSTQFLTDVEFADLVNDGIDALWADVTAVNKDFRVKVFPFSLTATATNFIAFPGDFREVRSVRRDPGTSNQRILQKLGERAGSTQSELSYRLQDTSLFIEPAINSVGAYDMRYTPQSPRLGKFQVRVASSTLPAYLRSLPGGTGVGEILFGAVNGVLTAQDGVTLVFGDRILFFAIGGAGSADYGIYSVTDVGSAGTPWILTRVTDFDEALPGEVAVGATVMPTEGTALKGNAFVLSAFSGVVGIGVQTWGTATFDTELDQFNEYVVLYAAILALGKEESESQASVFGKLLDPDMDGKKGIRGQVMRWASDQRAADPDQVEDVRGWRRNRGSWPAF